MKNVLIVFTDPHLPYSPTTLNLFNEVKKTFKVELISPEPDPRYSKQKVEDKGITYFKTSLEKTPSFLNRVLNKFKNSLFTRTSEQIELKSLLNNKAKTIIKHVEDYNGEIIAVDFFALWCVQQAGKKGHLLSLEIHENDPYKDKCDFEQIQSVIIQSEERYNYLFKSYKPKYFIIQNAPGYLDMEIDIESRKKNDLIYCGSAVPWFGITSCLDFLKDYSQYTLTIKGAVPQDTVKSINMFYEDLLIEGRLILDDTYLNTEDLTKYISRFRIGFAFYDFYRFEHIRTFNYFYAPSGKVFQYFNSGVPVTGNEIPGFKILDQRNAGVLIPYLSSQRIKQAIDTIESSYSFMANSAKKASFDLDFAKGVLPFINHLNSYV